MRRTWRARRTWRRSRFVVGSLLAAVVLGACGGGDRSVGVAAAGSGSSSEDDSSTTTSSATLPVPSSTTPSTPDKPRPVKVVSTTLTVPAVTVPPLPALPTVTLPVTTTTSPLPVPELFDARQGLGTPCDSAVEQHPDGCFFFVYATPATEGWRHRIHSDAPFRTEYTVPADDCGTASPHHPERNACVFYIGAVHDRRAGQVECFWATTVEGGSGTGPGARESAPSNRVCFTWTDQEPSPSGGSGDSGPG